MRFGNTNLCEKTFATMPYIKNNIDQHCIWKKIFGLTSTNDTSTCCVPNIAPLILIKQDKHHRQYICFWNICRCIYWHYWAQAKFFM